MIISASRRTDIPAFYSDWFLNRIKEGFVLVRNPMNFRQVSQVNLSPDVVDCIVFWTKNPQPMINRLSQLAGYNYYFQFTLTPYDNTIETNVPDKKCLIKTFQELSARIGRDKVIWRYDPILLTNKFDVKHHVKWFEFLANELNGHTKKCVVSFIDMYKKTERNLKGIDLVPMSEELMKEVAHHLSLISKRYNLQLEACCEDIDLTQYGIEPGKCIDDELISKIIGKKLDIKKDPNQRLSCGCVQSIDIGAYNTCQHRCLYCYANFNNALVDKNVRLHSTKSPLLYGSLEEEDKVSIRKVSSNISNQLSFLD
ncbi:MAG: DUF1848 domain-containing protein [Tepidanaerobacteraceae bacterium]|jgi:DNA repair photolyase|nr:DUF1848 domain-containing protein [Tepidanaerobacter sp.]HQA59899.1 DUF1848 domain-containing protein [Tepidanaerobacteraceae bacterium]HQE05316.1 DUF1848 domain-containing protein [Tepidanaerobacteraceae bacterium]